MSWRNLNVPALIESRLPASRARSRKKKLEPTTSRWASRSPTSSDVAPGGIRTKTVPVPLPLPGSNSEIANQATNTAASNPTISAIQRNDRRRGPGGSTPTGAGGGVGGAGGAEAERG